MTTVLRRLVSGSVPFLFLLSTTACDHDCDSRCNTDYDGCMSRAHDDEEKARCESELDQCRGICGAEPVDPRDPH